LRILGLDVGDKTIGIAVSDPMGWTAQGVEVWYRRDKGEDLAHVAQLVKRYDAACVVVGLPVNMNGTLGPQAEKVMAFVRELGEKVAVPVETWDERLTTRAAEQVLLQADLSRRKRKCVIDQVAAQLILQNYLDARADRHPGQTEVK